MSKTLETEKAVKNGVSRMIFAIASITVQVVLIILVNIIFAQKWVLFSIAFSIIALLVVLALISQPFSGSIKMPWILFILLVPVAGLSFYLLVGISRTSRKMRKRYEEIDDFLLPKLPEGDEAQEKLSKKLPYVGNITRYLKDYSRYPVYDNTKIDYYDDAAKGLEAQKKELRKAKDFIFMEYHAIEDAKSWSGIEEILVEKARDGLDVRVFYDDMGSIGFINTDFVKKLEKKGIACKVFNPFAPGLNIFLNNRDHRKITVVDGKVGFTGGYNLADEYFHLKEAFGFWKDTGVRLEGEAVKNLTLTFLEMWNATNDNGKYENDTDIEKFIPKCDVPEGAEGFVAPYADSPMDNEQVGEEVYMSVAESAKDYVWFITPYLIITEEMTHTLSLAAKRGVDVRVITPGIPDKKLIYAVTRSYYNGLARNGVRIYEYTPGFCHAKMSVADDVVATCGTINLDYRSLYHHFENGCLYADCKAVLDTKHDFEEIFKASEEVTDEYARGKGAIMRLGMLILRTLAPLM